MLNNLYASLYPSLIIGYNIAMNTQIGMLLIDEKMSNLENRRHLEHWTRSGEFFEDLHTKNWILVGVKWFNLAGVTDLVKFAEKYFNTVLKPTCMYGFSDGPRQYWQPIKFYEDGWAPIMFDYPMNQDKIEEYLNHVTTRPNQSF